jgi:hypothetical protein
VTATVVRKLRGKSGLGEVSQEIFSSVSTDLDDQESMCRLHIEIVGAIGARCKRKRERNEAFLGMLPSERSGNDSGLGKSTLG